MDMSNSYNKYIYAPKEPSISKKIFDIAIFITILPSYAYFITYLYEFGYCKAFSIPGYFVEPNLSTILFIIGVVIFPLSFIFFLFILIPFNIRMWLDKIPLPSSEKESPLKVILKIDLSFIVILALVHFTAENLQSFQLLFFFVSILGLNSLVFLEETFFKIVIDNFDTTTSKLSLVKYKFLFTIFWQKTASVVIFIILVVFIIPAGCYSMGLFEGKLEKNFQIFTQNPNRILIRKYGDFLICKDFSREHKTLGDSIILIKESDSKEIILKTEEVGPFYVK